MTAWEEEKTNPVALANGEALSLHQNLLVGILLCDAVSEVGCIRVNLYHGELCAQAFHSRGLSHASSSYHCVSSQTRVTCLQNVFISAPGYGADGLRFDDYSAGASESKFVSKF